MTSPERTDTERDAAPKVLGDAELAAIKERATVKSPTGAWLVDADIALLLVSHAVLRASLADAQTNSLRYLALAAWCDRESGYIVVGVAEAELLDRLCASSAALATVADELRKAEGKP